MGCKVQLDCGKITTTVLCTNAYWLNMKQFLYYFPLDEHD